jgi:hypothetical protein
MASPALWSLAPISPVGWFNWRESVGSLSAGLCGPVEQGASLASITRGGVWPMPYASARFSFLRSAQEAIEQLFDLDFSLLLLSSAFGNLKIDQWPHRTAYNQKPCEHEYSLSPRLTFANEPGNNAQLKASSTNPQSQIVYQETTTYPAVRYSAVQNFNLFRFARLQLFINVLLDLQSRQIGNSGI